MAEPSVTIQKGSLVLVTGITGFVGTHTAKQFLERGYKVRGTVRNIDTASWVVNGVLKAYAVRGDLELVEVPEMGADKAFDEAVKGVSAIAHVATNDLVPDPNIAIHNTVRGVTGLLEAALREPSVREFVFTGSIVAAVNLLDNKAVHVVRDTWNDAVIQLAWAPPPYDVARVPVVYFATKVISEKVIWAFAEQRHPQFNINVVSPASIIGLPLGSKHANTPPGYPTWMVRELFSGKTSGPDIVSGSESIDPPIPSELLESILVRRWSYGLWLRTLAVLSVDVQDIALLHVAAVLDPDTKSARIQAWGIPSTWNDYLAAFRRIWPQRKFIDDVTSSAYLHVTTDSSQALELLKKWGHGQDGWRPFEQSVKDTFVEVN